MGQNRIFSPVHLRVGSENSLPTMLNGAKKGRVLVFFGLVLDAQRELEAALWIC